MYDSLTKRYREQDNRTVFAHFPWREDMGEIWETPFQRLAEKARPESWNALQRRNSREFPVLIAYLNHTFLRLQEQDKIRHNADNSRACLNTGLQSADGLDIYATFYRNQGALEYDQPDWTLFGFFDAYSDRLREFDPLPDAASYVEDPQQLIYDYRLALDIDYRHILNEYTDRLPNVLRDNPILAHNALEGAVSRLLERVRRQYNLAVPGWYTNRVQLFLPLCLLNHHSADLALVVERSAAGDKYEAHTVVSLDIAYINARVLCPLHQHWLAA